MSDTIDTFLDEVLDVPNILRMATEKGSISKSDQHIQLRVVFYDGKNETYPITLSYDLVKASIKQFIENRVREAKGEVVKKCNATGKKSMCPRCEYPALFERAVGGTECIVCEYQMPF